MSHPTIRLGDTGEWVEYAQRQLGALHFYSGAIDGRFGPVTDAAVRAFQTSAGLSPVDGVVGEATWAALVASQTVSFSEDVVQRGQAIDRSLGDTVLVADDGRHLAYGWRRQISREGATAPADGASGVILGGLIQGVDVVSAVPTDTASRFSSSVGAVRSAGSSAMCTGAFGMQVELAAGIGLAAGSGWYLSSSGDYGWYTSCGGDLGWVATASVGNQATIVLGGPSSLGGDCFALVVSVSLTPELPLGPSVGITLLFQPNLRFLGIAFDLSIGLGQPLNFYAQAMNTRIHPVGDAW